MSQSYVEERPQPIDGGQVKTSDRSGSANSQKLLSANSSEDLIYGQPVIVAARWILIASGLGLAIWNADDIGQLRLQILVILILAVANFYLHAQLLIKRPVIAPIVYAASAADLFLITVLILGQGGYDSPVFVYYFPAIAVFAVAFMTPLTVLYVVTTIFMYGFISLFSGGEALATLSRLIMIVAVGFCGNLYFRIERSRRQAAEQAQKELMVQLRKRQAAAA